MSGFDLKKLLNDKSNSGAAPDKTKFKVEMLPIEKIMPSDMNKYTVANIDDLKASIEMIGLQQNLLVRAHDETGTYELISGHRRFKAMKELYAEGNADFATVPCKVIKSVDDINAELQLLFGNSTVRQMSDWERTYQAKRIKELLTALKKSGYKFKGRMRQIVADILDVSPAQVGRMESISENLSPEFQQQFRDGNIGSTAAYQLSRLPKEQQEQEYADYQETGAAKVRDIEKKRENEKPKPAAKPEKMIRQALPAPPSAHAEPEKSDEPQAYTVNHELKTLPEYFKEVENGNKTFEFRKDDRGFKVGDILRLREHSHNLDDVETGLLAEKFIDVKVTYILHGGQMGVPEGFAILSIAKL